MKTKILVGGITLLAILLGCAAPQKEMAPQKPITEEIAPTRSDLDSKLTDLTNQITSSLTETRRPRIAVIEFSDLKGNIREFGIYLSEELITRLSRTRKFEKVVERQLLNKIIEEHKLSYTHFFDEETVKEVGKLLGVDAIASGSVGEIGRTLKVNARLIDTETGSIVAVAAVKILKDAKVARLWDNIVKPAPGVVAPHPPPPTNYVWHDGVLRVTVESLIKTGKNVIVVALFENISDRPIHVAFRRLRAHLLDENGCRWKFQLSDSAQIVSGREISPSKRIRTRMPFTAKESDRGGTFDLFLESRGIRAEHAYSLSIQNIKIH